MTDMRPEHEQEEGHKHYMVILYAEGQQWGTTRECSCHHDEYDAILAREKLDMGEYVWAEDKDAMTKQLRSAIDGTAPGIRVYRLEANITGVTVYEHEMCSIAVAVADLERVDLGYKKPEGSEYINLGLLQKAGRNLARNMGKAKDFGKPPPKPNKSRLN